MSKEFNLFRITEYCKDPYFVGVVGNNVPFVSEEGIVFVSSLDLTEEGNEAIQEEYFVGNPELSWGGSTCRVSGNDLKEVSAVCICNGNWEEEGSLYIFSKEEYERVDIELNCRVPFSC